MNYAMILYVLAWISLCTGCLMLAPLGVSIYYNENPFWFLPAILLCLLIAVPLLLTKPKSRVFFLKEGFVITSFGWLLMSLLGCIPFLISKSIPNFVDALFETVSGFTTTGASILNDVEALPKSILFWRSLTHWIGGMGVLVFLLVLIPKAGGSNTNLMKAESPGPQVEKLVPKIRDSALILYGIYIFIMVAEIIALRIAKMPWFDTITLSFGTAGTGGFGIKNDSIGSYSASQQSIIAVFMFLFGINFNFYFYLLLRKFKKAGELEDVKWYFGMVLCAAIFIAVNVRTMFGSFAEAFHQSFFQVASLVSSTGYSTYNYELWPDFSKTILFLMMLIGACAGSTGGGFKVSRAIILIKDIKRQLLQVLQPNRIISTKIDGKTIDNHVIDTNNAYLAAFVLIYIISVLLVSLDGFDMVTNITSVAATLNNIGPGFSMTGPANNFSLFSPAVKLLLSFDMITGRLELFPVLILFSRKTWK